MQENTRKLQGKEIGFLIFNRNCIVRVYVFL
jgi:hypothetical protein